MAPDASSPIQGSTPGCNVSTSLHRPTRLSLAGGHRRGGSLGSNHLDMLGSPTLNSHHKPPQSPLRKTVFTHDDLDDDDAQTTQNGAPDTPPAFRGIIDFANSQIGRTAMSYTGDRRRRTTTSRVDDEAQAQAAAAATSAAAAATIPSLSPPQKRQNAPSEASVTPKNSPVPGGSSRFASFASNMFKGLSSSASSPRLPTSSSGGLVTMPQDDELMNLDIDEALHAHRSEGDAFSPAAYKNLEQTASGLLHRFQAAYQQRTIEHAELRAERTVYQDERDESETRMHHLRMQLEDMARKAAEHEALVQSLVDDLDKERSERQRIMATVAGAQQQQKAPTLSSSAASMSEDLGAEEDQRRRREWQRRSINSTSSHSSGSGISTSSSAGMHSGAEGSSSSSRPDLVFDTDDESVVEDASLFSSRSRSPTIATTLTDMGPPSEPPMPPQLNKAATLRAPQQQQQQQQMNTFQKLFKGISGEPQVVTSCQNCEGQEASVAWDTVNLLKDENKGLKLRVSDLETAVEGALDAAIGVGI